MKDLRLRRAQSFHPTREREIPLRKVNTLGLSEEEEGSEPWKEVERDTPNQRESVREIASKKS